jgi:catechol 2,3-dioxygenase-like lactoylglutathione lyase family enzyme
MFKDRNSSAIVAVSDLDRAKHFYGETLGLEADGDIGPALTFKTGATRLIVYESAENAGTNKANAVVWGADGDFDALAEELRGNGVTFEEYPDMGMRIEHGVHVQDGFKSVWFKDPDGNILHLNNM